MNFILEMALSSLDLTEAEHAAVEKSLPDAKAVMDSINTVMPDLRRANQLWVQNQTMVLRMFTDVDKIGPAASALLGDGWVDFPSVLSAANDIKKAIEADPNLSKSCEGLYAKLEPVVMGAYAKWPNIKPGYDAIMAALARKHTTVGQLLDRMSEASK